MLCQNVCFDYNIGGHTAKVKYIQTYLHILALVFVKSSVVMDTNKSLYYQLNACVLNILKVINE